MYSIAEIVSQPPDMAESIRGRFGCGEVAEAPISTITSKKVWVTDDARCFTYSTFQHKPSFTECKKRIKSGKYVFNFNGKTTARACYNAAKLVYSAFHGIDYEEMGEVLFKDGDCLNVNLSNLVYERNDAHLGVLSMTKYSESYKSRHRDISKFLWYTFQKTILYEDCRDLVSSVFFWLCRHLDSDPPRTPIVDFVGLWVYYCKKKMLKYVERSLRRNPFDETLGTGKSEQSSSWEIYDLIKKYIKGEEREGYARLVARGWSNEDLSEVYGLTMEQANSQRQGIVRTLRKKLNPGYIRRQES